jgi:hypothetical protein
MRVKLPKLPKNTHPDGSCEQGGYQFVYRSKRSCLYLDPPSHAQVGGCRCCIDPNKWSNIMSLLDEREKKLLPKGTTAVYYPECDKCRISSAKSTQNQKEKKVRVRVKGSRSQKNMRDQGTCAIISCVCPRFYLIRPFFRSHNCFSCNALHPLFQTGLVTWLPKLLNQDGSFNQGTCQLVTYGGNNKAFYLNKPCYDNVGLCNCVDPNKWSNIKSTMSQLELLVLPNNTEAVYLAKCDACHAQGNKWTRDNAAKKQADAEARRVYGENVCIECPESTNGKFTPKPDGNYLKKAISIPTEIIVI